METIIISIIIIIIRHQLGLNRPVSTSSNSLFKDLPFRLRPFGLQFNITSAVLLLFILLHVVADFVCIFLVSGQMVLLSGLQKCCHSFSDQKGLTSPAVLLNNFISTDVNSFFHFFLGSKFRSHIKEKGDPVIIHFYS
jgi:hypothetical protein